MLIASLPIRIGDQTGDQGFIHLYIPEQEASSQPV